MAKRQVCIIHGGATYLNDAEYQNDLRNMQLNYQRLLYAPSWKNWLAEQLPDRDVLLPSMPSRDNAKYDDWALQFSKILPFLEPDVTLIGHSLGGIFLAKYFSEHQPDRPFNRLVLIAAPYDDETSESLGDFKFDNARSLATAARQIDIFCSQDDPIVVFSESEKYQADLPAATVHRFVSYGHFNTPTFPELLECIA